MLVEKITIFALAMIVLIAVARLFLQEIRKLLVEWEKTVLRYKKTHYQIKSSKQSNNPLNQQIQQKDSHNHQFQSNQSLPYLLHRDNILKQKGKSKRKKGIRKKVRNKLDLKGKNTVESKE